MKFVLRWNPAAVEDLESILAWCEANFPSGKREYVISLLATVEELQRFPHLGRSMLEPDLLDCRELVVRDHLVAYRLQGHVVEILRIWHMRQIPPPVPPQ